LVSEQQNRFARGLLWREQERQRRGLNVHERRLRRTHDAKRPAQKKWPLRRAAKFREETPRKGGGFAIEDRDTALQQYAGTGSGLQVFTYNHSRQNAAEILKKSVTLPKFPAFCCLFRHLCGAIYAQEGERGRFITPSHLRNKRFV
jgi:hypothetical protein